MPRWTSDEYAAYQARNRKPVHPVDGLCASQPEPAQGQALVSDVPREETRWFGSAQCFEITFTIYALRPLDWDNSYTKPAQDFLHRIGIIPSDKWSALSGRVISRKARSKEEERTEIEITTL